ncbi:putative HTH-type transcriptional regulator type 3 [Gottschalkia acidurici 9a]|uniref:HTH-type transcriptional regulator type 3 n=1 Tax=Gottschalkia acidurici (strain ATCC 7906 / DSM 604 / BCRC 14475 / CIP 104303 / KCTC 5404 / NCIMB 10678 / 9a) TaxID=1128398 RepID=K0AZQ7_GOTA9|nr:helix-turn-helix transcriptional regulator [Gottschalkia acidurici]AFS77841.1 putative HTH-type transcriptional regulator type 3 [Gottschalkia acidurici 9a]
MDNVYLGSRIKELRRHKNLTQEQLAELVNISTTHIGQIERGERGASLDTLISICNCLEVTLDYLLKDYIDNEDELLRNQWNVMLKGRSDKEKDLVIKMVRTLIEGLDECKE